MTWLFSDNFPVVIAGRAFDEDKEGALFAAVGAGGGQCRWTRSVLPSGLASSITEALQPAKSLS